MRQFAYVTLVGLVTACGSSDKPRSSPDDVDGGDTAAGGNVGTGGRTGSGGAGSGGAGSGAAGGSAPASGGAGTGGLREGGTPEAGTPEAGTGGALADAGLDARMEASAPDATLDSSVPVEAEAGVTCVDGATLPCDWFAGGGDAGSPVLDPGALTFEVTLLPGLPRVTRATLAVRVFDCAIDGIDGADTVVNVNVTVTGDVLSADLASLIGTFDTVWIESATLSATNECGDVGTIIVSNSGNYSLGACTDAFTEPTCGPG